MKMILPIYVSGMSGSLGSQKSGMSIYKSTFQNDVLCTENTGTSAHPFFSSGSSYSKDTIVMYGRNGYKKLTTATPSTVSPDLDPTNWALAGPSHRYAMFDLSLSTKATGNGGGSGTDELIIDLYTDPVNGVALIGDFQSTQFVVQVINITNRSTGAYTVVWSSGFVSTNSVTGSGSIFVQLNASYAGSQFYQNGDYALRIFGPAIISGLNELIIGQVVDIGKAKKDWSVSINDYSKKVVDAYGNVSVSKRGFSKTLDIETYIDSDAIANNIPVIFGNYRSSVIQWIGLDTIHSTWILGYLQKWQMRYTDVNQYTLSLSIEGVV